MDRAGSWLGLCVRFDRFFSFKLLRGMAERGWLGKVEELTIDTEKKEFDRWIEWASTDEKLALAAAKTRTAVLQDTARGVVGRVE